MHTGMLRMNKSGSCPVVRWYSPSFIPSSVLPLHTINLDAGSKPLPSHYAPAREDACAAEIEISKANSDFKYNIVSIIDFLRPVWMTLRRVALLLMPRQPRRLSRPKGPVKQDIEVILQ